MFPNLVNILKVDLKFLLFWPREKRSDCDDDPPFRDGSPRGPILQLREEGRATHPFNCEVTESRFGDFGTSNIPNPIISFAGPPPLKNALVVSDGGGGTV